MHENQSTLEQIKQILKTYKPSKTTKRVVAESKIALLVGISGAGKDTIQHELLKSQQFHPIISHTTRPPRTNQGVLEINGQQYHFINIKTALSMLQSGTYIEANVYGGNVYGTTIKDIQNAQDHNLIAITDIDVNGVANFKKISSQVIAIFIVPPSFDEWQRRLLARYREASVEPEDLYKRMQTAVQELEHALAMPYFHFVVNDDLDVAAHAVKSIANGDDSFNEKDQKVREQAGQLLEDLRAHLTT